jgi:hypothetical protein
MHNLHCDMTYSMILPTSLGTGDRFRAEGKTNEEHPAFEG